MNTETLPQLHDIPWVMRRLHLSRSKVFDLLATGQLRSVKVGTRRLISEQAVADFVANLEAESA